MPGAEPQHTAVLAVVTTTLVCDITAKHCVRTFQPELADRNTSDLNWITHESDNGKPLRQAVGLYRAVICLYIMWRHAAV